MTWDSEGKNRNGEPKKSGLLPAGDNAKEVVEVLAAMYTALHNPENATDDDAKDEHGEPVKMVDHEKEIEE